MVCPTRIKIQKLQVKRFCLLLGSISDVLFGMVQEVWSGMNYTEFKLFHVSLRISLASISYPVAR